MKIRIIFPAQLDLQNRPVHTRSREGKILNLSFIYLAGLTPSGHDVQVIDEFFEEISFDDPADLVAITAMTSQAPRAYQIAKAFQQRGVPVVMGGFHATFFPDEAAGHVDAVVIGEAEGVWEALLEDAQKGALKKFYKRQAPTTSLEGLPVPRYDLIDQKPYRYNYYPVWVGRGCPHDCSYCTVNRFYGRHVRVRPVADVIRDVAAVSAGRIFFIDDNLFSYRREYLNDLLSALVPYRLRWLAQMDPGTMNDPALLDLARKAGLEIAYIGMESFSPDGLHRLSKGWADIDRYSRLVNDLHRRGIIVFASMMIGINRETPDTIRATLDRLEKLKVNELALYILTPAPGSRMWEDLEAGGAGLPRNWSIYDGTHAITAPDGMTAAELENLYWSLYRRFYSPRSVMRRFARIPHSPHRFVLSVLRNLLVFSADVRACRSVHSNDFSLKNLVPGYSSRYPGKTFPES
ncbi:MAG: B12-binding domain-containing radical SAM protein [Thermodesulfobacteriota bacterium]